MNIKNNIRNFSIFKIRQKLGLTKPMENTIVVASLGRCGSTLMVNSLAKAYKRQEHRRDIIRLDDHINEYHTSDKTIDRGFDSKESEKKKGQFLKGYVYKTHDYPPPYLPKNVKVIFIFANPIDIVLSAKTLDKIPVKGLNNDNFTHLDLHIRNLRGNFEEKNLLFQKDVLKLSDNFNAWHKKHSFPLMTLRYETMWNYIDLVRWFTGFKNFNLPPHKKRRDLTLDYDQEILSKIKKVYKNLTEQIESSSDVAFF